jgi:uncharacterized protein YjbJ (UPF0337 family)
MSEAILGPSDHQGHAYRWSLIIGEKIMSSFEKAKGKTEQLIGKAEKKVGQMLGHEDLENAGERDQLTGEVKEADHDLHDDSVTGPANDAGAADDTPNQGHEAR